MLRGIHYEAGRVACGEVNDFYNRGHVSIEIAWLFMPRLA
jgi:hypothetical protein